MKLLLDEKLPHKLRTEIVGHEVFTVAYTGWSGIQNGELLAKAAAEGFRALVTNDRGLEYEVNQNALPLAVIVLISATNTIDDLRPLLPALDAVLRTLTPNTLIRVGSQD